MIKNNFKKIFLTVILFSFFIVKITSSATLFTEINNVNVQIGDVVTATVYVNAGNESINNVEGLVKVSSDILEVQSVSSSGSILNLWVEQPTYADGLVAFNGGVTTPGYSGSQGKVVTIFMKALKNGTANIAFQSASVRANDGFGTDVLKSKSGSTVVVASVVEKPVLPQTENIPINSIGIPKLPIVSSSLTPDIDKWYQADSTTFSWDLPNDVIAVRTLFGQYPNSEPTVSYEPPISSRKIDNLTEGVWYFHLRYRNINGWGPILHKKIQIDKTLPVITDLNYEKQENGSFKLLANVDDKLSGVEKVNILIDNEIIEINEIIGNKVEYVFENKYSGQKNIQLIAYDKAGNSFTSSIEIVFPIIEQQKLPENVVEQEPQVKYVIWGESIIRILSIIVPILAIILLIIILVYFAFTRMLLDPELRRKIRINKIEKEISHLIGTFKDNLLEDVHLLRIDKNIKDMNEAEDILLKNLLKDIKNMEKSINSRIRKNKIKNKDIEIQ